MGASKRLNTASMLGKRNTLGGRLARGDGFHVSFDMFFDRPHVMARLDKKRLRVLSRVGAYTMGAMRKSMRRAKEGDNLPSVAPKPPKSRMGQLRNFTFFGLDRQKQETVVGPAKLGSGSVSVPRVLDEGGMAQVTLPGGEMVLARYLPRPFAGPTSPAFLAGNRFFEQLIKETPL